MPLPVFTEISYGEKKENLTEEGVGRSKTLGYSLQTCPSLAVNLKIKLGFHFVCHDMHELEYAPDIL